MPVLQLVATRAAPTPRQRGSGPVGPRGPVHPAIGLLALVVVASTGLGPGMAAAQSTPDSAQHMNHADSARAVTPAPDTLGATRISLRPERRTDTSGLPSLRLRGPLRGDLSGAMTLNINAATRSVILSVPPLDVPARALVRMEVRNAKGRIVYSGDHRQADLELSRLVMTTDDGRPLVPGSYTLIMSELPSKTRSSRELERSEYTFALAPQPR